MTKERPLGITIIALSIVKVSPSIFVIKDVSIVAMVIIQVSVFNFAMYALSIVALSIYGELTIESTFILVDF